MVSSNYRGSQVLYHLLAEGYHFTKRNNLIYNFCYCAPHLIGLYEQLGYRRYTKNYIHPETGFNIPMVLIMDDVSYLQKVHSPFYRLARKSGAEHNQQASEWFYEQFPQLTHFTTRKAMSEEQFWSLIHVHLKEAPKDKIPILKGLTEEEVQCLFKQTTVLKCDQGDMILRDQNVGNELFIILSGAVEVTKHLHGKDYSVAFLGQAEIFGEMAFVASTIGTANVMAITSSEILVLTKEFFNKFIIQYPSIASKVLLNLSVILCNRLGESTQNWVNSAAQILEEPPELNNRILL